MGQLNTVEEVYNLFLENFYFEEFWRTVSFFLLAIIFASFIIFSGTPYILLKPSTAGFVVLNQTLCGMV